MKNFQKILLIMFGNEHNLSVYEQILKIIGHIDFGINLALLLLREKNG